MVEKVGIVGMEGPEARTDLINRIVDRMGNVKARELLGVTRVVKPTAPWKRRTAKVGRNEPCPCGSGKKYKKCCLNSG